MACAGRRGYKLLDWGIYSCESVLFCLFIRRFCRGAPVSGRANRKMLNEKRESAEMAPGRRRAMHGDWQKAVEPCQNGGQIAVKWQPKDTRSPQKPGHDRGLSPARVSVWRDWHMAPSAVTIIGCCRPGSSAWAFDDHNSGSFCALLAVSLTGLSAPMWFWCVLACSWCLLVPFGVFLEK